MQNYYNWLSNVVSLSANFIYLSDFYKHGSYKKILKKNKNENIFS